MKKYTITISCILAIFAASVSFAAGRSISIESMPATDSVDFSENIYDETSLRTGTSVQILNAVRKFDRALEADSIGDLVSIIGPKFSFYQILSENQGVKYSADEVVLYFPDTISIFFSHVARIPNKSVFVAYTILSYKINGRVMREYTTFLFSAQNPTKIAGIISVPLLQAVDN